ILLLIRYLLGLREEEMDHLTVRPVLPQALRRTGATYYIGPITWGKYSLYIECVVKDAKRYRLRLGCVVPAPRENLGSAQERTLDQEPQEYQCEWEGAWGEER